MFIRVLLSLLVFNTVQASGPLAFHCDSLTTSTPFGADSIGLCYTLDDKQEGSISWQPQLDAGVIENVSGLTYSEILIKVKSTSATGRLPTIKELASIVSYSNDAPFQHYQLLNSWFAGLPADSVLLSSTYRTSSPESSNHDGLLGINISTREIELVDLALASPKYVLIANPSDESYVFRMKQGSNCIDRHTGFFSRRIQAYSTCRNSGSLSEHQVAQQWAYNPVTGLLRNIGENDCAYNDGGSLRRISCNSDSVSQQWDFINQAFRPRSNHDVVITYPGSSSEPISIEALAANAADNLWDFDYWSDL